MNTKLLFDSGRVQRYHMNPKLARYGQTNADHQWGCVALLLALHPRPSAELITVVALHDVDEVLGGDLGFHFKKENPDLVREHERRSKRMADEAGLPVIGPFDEKEELWLTLVDRLESFLYMREHGQEWALGEVRALLKVAKELNVIKKVEEIIRGN